MLPKTSIRLIFLLPIWLYSLIASAQLTLPSQCCDNGGTCEALAQSIADDLMAAFASLGTAPANDVQARQTFASLTASQQRLINQSVTQFLSKTNDVKNCINNKISVSSLTAQQKAAVTSWLSFFLSETTGTPTLPSPNFQKGWDVFASVNMLGGSRLFTDDRQFASIYSVLFGRTIGRNDPAKSRNFRWLIGATYYRQAEEILITPRIDIRLFDLEFAPANLGAVKTHLEANVGEEILITTGLGIETYLISIHVITLGYDGFTEGFFATAGFALNLSDL